MDFRIKAYDGVKIELKEFGEDVVFVDVDMNFDKKQTPQPITIEWNVPADGMYAHLNVDAVTVENNRSLGYGWDCRTTKSRLERGAPVHGIVGANNDNKLNISLLDAATPIEIKTGIIEEDVSLFCKVVFFTLPISPIKEYHTIIRIDRRDVPFYDSYYDVNKWWSENELSCAYVPETAKEPMYSTWYSFHQNISTEKILKQCELAKQMGMEAVIVDDGWQTDDVQRGYAYCGDWEPTDNKIPDMKALVDGVHALGMKFMLWYSVPFVGKHSKAYERFKDKFLHFGEKCGYGELDPRYPDVREYISGLYEEALLKWGIDGFKLDFIDSFVLTDDTVREDARRDIESLEDAVEALISDVSTRLRSINPDILLEFRQQYIGPKIRRYGNMLRACDCAADPIMNRCRTIILRLTSGDTAVHADMIEWSMNDTVENAARQLYNAAFSVPQISVLIDKLPEEHYNMLKFYLKFWRENKDVLIGGKLCAYAPESNFTKAYSVLDEKMITVLYEDKVAEINDCYDDIKIVNAGTSDYIILDSCIDSEYIYQILNCVGDVVGAGKLKIDGVCRINVPETGILKLNRML